MLQKIKQTLLDNPDKLVQVLSHFGYCGIVNHHNNYISCGRDENSSKKSIVIRLQNNENLFVKDYPLNISKDIYSYISSQRNLEFKQVLGEIKDILGIENYYSYFNESKKSIFGGFYDKTSTNKYSELKIYDSSILDKYEVCPNKRFIKDNISIKTQIEFGIRYDVESQGIIIPIYDQFGNLLAVKERMNYDLDSEDFQKYWYLFPGRTSQTLYGYSQNYNYLNNNLVLVGEAEKFVLQCASYGYRNAVGLGSGSISPTQIQLILNLNPESVIFCHDYKYDVESIQRNINLFKNYSRFNDIPIGWWDWRGYIYPEKVSPTDMGKKTFEEILNYGIKWEKTNEEIQNIV